jgi:hypothetical protein
MPVREQRWERGDTTKYHDSESGQLSRSEDYSPEGRLTCSVDYTYDDRGNNIERVVRDGTDKLIRRLQFEFDVQDREIIHREYDSANILQFTRHFDYLDAQRRQVHTKYVTGEETVEIENYA